METVFETKYSPEFGRYLVAKKSFKAGDRVFSEAPLIVTSFTANYEKIQPLQFICYGCLKMCNKVTSLHCSQCSWFACSEECLHEPWHTEYECPIFTSEDIAPSYNSLRYLYLVRSLVLREKDATAWSELLKLTSVIQKSDKNLESFHQAHVEKAYTFLTTQCFFEVEKDLVLKLMKIFFINTFGLMYEDKLGNKYNGEVLYATSCLLAHSCCPNMDWVLMSTNDVEGFERWHMYLYARVKIEVGDMVTIPYLQDPMEEGTMERRSIMVESFHFCCSCTRCSDPSEFNTNFSGIVCKACDGVILPSNPLEFDTEWKCTTCSKILPVENRVKIVEKYENHYQNIVANHQNRLAKLDKLIKDCRSVYNLHDNHYKVIKAKVYWLRHVSLDLLMLDGSYVDNLYDFMMTRAKSCLKVVSKVGDLYSWVTCERMIAKFIIKYRFKSQTFMSVERYDYTLDEKILILKRILKHLGRGIRLVQPNFCEIILEENRSEMVAMYAYYKTKLDLAELQATLAQNLSHGQSQ